MGTTPTQPASSESGRAPTQQITLRGAVFLGIGAMVGAGIFALLGQAGDIAGAAVWISFLVGRPGVARARIRDGQDRAPATRPRAV